MEGKEVMNMGVEGNHGLGCGALNGTGACSCEPLTPEVISRQAERGKQAALLQEEKDRLNGVGLNITESLRRLEQKAQEAKAQAQA